MNAHGQSAAAAAEEQPQLWQHLDSLDTFPGLLDPPSNASLSMSTMNSSSSNHAAADEQIQRLNAQVGYGGKTMN